MVDRSSFQPSFEAAAFHKHSHDRKPFASGLKLTRMRVAEPDAFPIQPGEEPTTKSAASVIFDLMELEIKHWASTPSMIARARSSSGWLLRVTRGRTATSVIQYLPSTCSSRPSASLSYAVGVTPFAWASVRKVSIMQVFTEATSSSSGAQKLGSPLNSGGLPTTTSGFAGAESVPRRPELQVVFAL